MRKSWILITLILLVNVYPVSSQLTLPKGIEQIKEYNLETAQFYSKNLTFSIAFLAGILSILSPCILPLLPAFFSYTFKEKIQITKMTFVFFIGFSLMFILMGLVAAYIGGTIIMIQKSASTLILIAGIFLIFFGIMSMFGKGFSSFLKFKKKPKNDVLGVLLFGSLFALGWTACLGPILSGVLLMASVLQNYVYSGLLLFIYSLGIFIPLFIFSFFFDKYNLTQLKWIKGKEVVFNVSARKIRTHSISLISGLLLIIVGLVFIIYRGTNIVNIIDPLGTRMLFYDLQNKLIGSNFLNVVGVVLMITFIFLLWKFISHGDK